MGTLFGLHGVDHEVPLGISSARVPHRENLLRQLAACGLRHGHPPSPFDRMVVEPNLDTVELRNIGTPLGQAFNTDDSRKRLWQTRLLEHWSIPHRQHLLLLFLR